MDYPSSSRKEEPIGPCNAPSHLITLPCLHLVLRMSQAPPAAAPELPSPYTRGTAMHQSNFGAAAIRQRHSAHRARLRNLRGPSRYSLVSAKAYTSSRSARVTGTGVAHQPPELPLVRAARPASARAQVRHGLRDVCVEFIGRRHARHQSPCRSLGAAEGRVLPAATPPPPRAPRAGAAPASRQTRAESRACPRHRLPCRRRESSRRPVPAQSPIAASAGPTNSS